MSALSTANEPGFPPAFRYHEPYPRESYIYEQLCKYKSVLELYRRIIHFPMMMYKCARYLYDLILHRFRGFSGLATSAFFSNMNSYRNRDVPNIKQQ